MEHRRHEPAAALSETRRKRQPLGKSVQNKTSTAFESGLLYARSYHRRRLRDASEEEEVGQEEADTQVQVDGGAGPLNGAAELEGQDGEHETQQ